MACSVPQIILKFLIYSHDDYHRFPQSRSIITRFIFFALINCAYIAYNWIMWMAMQIVCHTVCQSATVIHSIRIRCMARGIKQWTITEFMICIFIQMLTVTRNKILIFVFCIYVKLSSFYFQLQILIAISLITSICILFFL